MSQEFINEQVSGFTNKAPDQQIRIMVSVTDSKNCLKEQEKIGAM